MSKLIQVRDILSTEEEKTLKISFQRYREGFQWILANRENLEKKYPDKYIAVKDKIVQFTADTMLDLVSKIRKAEMDVEDFVIEYIGTEEVTLLL